MSERRDVFVFVCVRENLCHAVNGKTTLVMSWHTLVMLPNKVAPTFTLVKVL